MKTNIVSGSALAAAAIAFVLNGASIAPAAAHYAKYSHHHKAHCAKGSCHHKMKCHHKSKCHHYKGACHHKSKCHTR